MESRRGCPIHGAWVLGPWRGSWGESGGCSDVGLSVWLARL